MKMNVIDWIAFVLVIIGGLNWGLIGIFNTNLVSIIFGSINWLLRTVYVLVGLSAIYMLYLPTKE